MFKNRKNRKQHSRIGGCLAVVCVRSTTERRLADGRKQLSWRQILQAAGVLILCLAVLSGCSDDGSAVIIDGTVQAENTGTEKTSETSESQDSEAVSGGLWAGETAVQPTTEMAVLYVHVCGQVVTPGVYELPEGSRVWDAVEAAGGFTETAEPDAVNLALTVADGSKVTIPSREEAQDRGFRWYETGSGLGASGVDNSADGTDGSGRVDINRADVAQLMTIPGIGEVRAEAIIAYRESHGSFGAVEEIMNVTGIKEGLFSKIRDYITVGG